MQHKQHILKSKECFVQIYLSDNKKFIIDHKIRVRRHIELNTDENKVMDSFSLYM